MRSCDAEHRVDLLRNIVCQGGHTRMPGFAERLQLEVVKLVAERGLGGSEALCKPHTLMRAVDAPAAGSHRRKVASKASQPVEVVVANAGQHSAWAGGSAVSCLSTFASKWISREEYMETGPTLVHQRSCW